VRLLFQYGGYGRENSDVASVLQLRDYRFGLRCYCLVHPPRGGTSDASGDRRNVSQNLSHNHPSKHLVRFWELTMFNLTGLKRRSTSASLISSSPRFRCMQMSYTGIQQLLRRDLTRRSLNLVRLIQRTKL
jgi:hypothetical protein